MLPCRRQNLGKFYNWRGMWIQLSSKQEVMLLGCTYFCTENLVLNKFRNRLQLFAVSRTGPSVPASNFLFSSKIIKNAKTARHDPSQYAILTVFEKRFLLQWERVFFGTPERNMSRSYLFNYYFDTLLTEANRALRAFRFVNVDVLISRKVLNYTFRRNGFTGWCKLLEDFLWNEKVYTVHWIVL